MKVAKWHAEGWCECEECKKLPSQVVSPQAPEKNRASIDSSAVSIKALQLS